MKIIENVELSCTRRGPNKPRAHTASHSCPVEDFVARSARALFEEGLSWIEMMAKKLMMVTMMVILMVILMTKMMTLNVIMMVMNMKVNVAFVMCVLSNVSNM